MTRTRLARFSLSGVLVFGSLAVFACLIAALAQDISISFGGRHRPH